MARMQLLPVKIPGSDWAFYAKTFSWAQKIQSETSIRMSRETGFSVKRSKAEVSRPFLKTFAAVFPDPTDGPQVSEDAADKEPNVHQKLRACKT